MWVKIKSVPVVNQWVKHQGLVPSEDVHFLLWDTLIETGMFQSPSPPDNVAHYTHQFISARWFDLGC